MLGDRFSLIIILLLGIIILKRIGAVRGPATDVIYQAQHGSDQLGQLLHNQSMFDDLYVINIRVRRIICPILRRSNTAFMN